MHETIHFWNPYDETNNLILFSEKLEENVAYALFISDFILFVYFRLIFKFHLFHLKMVILYEKEKKILVVLVFKEIPHNNAIFLCLAALV